MPEKQTLEFIEVKKRLMRFAKRFYLNSLLQNLAVYLTTTASILLIMSSIEYFSNNNSLIRAFLFYGFVLLSAAGFIYLVFIPGLRSFGIIHGMSEQALSEQVGKRMGNIEDKLLNILLLEKMNAHQSNEMIEAAINQKSGEIVKIPFHLSASFKRGALFARNAGLFLIVLTFLGMSFPDVINYGTKRLVFYNQDIEPPPPFNFILESELTTIKNEAYEIKVKVEGEILPKTLLVETDEWKQKAIKVSQNEFRYSIKSVSGDFKFKLEAEGVKSKEYTVKALNRPTIVNFMLDITYPKYLNKANEKLMNVGNVTIPEGSNLKWEINANDADFLKMQFSGGQKSLNFDETVVQFDSTFLSSTEYSLEALSSNGLRSDSIKYRVAIIKDQRPTIDLILDEDSIDGSKDKFMGRIADDYGITAFRFGFKINDEKEIKYEDLRFDSRSNIWDFQYEIDWNKWQLNKGDEVVYFFEVWDNDGINGRKSSRSANMLFRLPDNEEMEGRKEELADQIQKEMVDAIKEAKKINKEVEDLQKDLMLEKTADWTTKKKVEDLLRRNENLKKQVEAINDRNKQKNSFEDNLRENDELKNKRDELERLMEEILDDEMLEKLKELESLMDKINKEQLKEEMDKIELSSEQLENELDRSLELFKQLEFEMQLDKALEDIEKSLVDQQSLTEKTEKDEKGDLASEQEKIKEEFESVAKELEKLEELNEDLENKHDIEDQDSKSNEVKDEMEQAKKELEKGKKKNASKNQKSAEDKMSQMKDDLNALKADMQGQSQEDMQSLRNTMENLIELSFEQEKIMKEMRGMRGDDPRFNESTKEQRGILDGMSIVEDSLRALGKRIVQIEATVNKEVLLSKNSMEKSIRAMTERKMDDVQLQQQRAMTSLNNLGLLLSEILDQLQQQMKQNSGQCSKPGNSKPSKSSMKQMQQQLNKEISEMKSKMENGQSPGDKPGKNKAQSESLAKMAAEQAKIREELRNMAKESSHEQAHELYKIGDLMEETERDIVNRNITRETLLRQEKILTKLLESESADRQQDIDDKREANQGNEKINGNLFDLKEYYKARNNTHEELMKQNISYNRFYKDKVVEYFKKMSK